MDRLGNFVLHTRPSSEDPQVFDLRIMRRNTRQKSPVESDDSMDFKKTSGGRKPAGSSFTSMMGGKGGSPILSHKSSSGGAGFGVAGLGGAFTMDFYKSTQVCS